MFSHKNSTLMRENPVFYPDQEPCSSGTLANSGEGMSSQYNNYSQSIHNNNNYSQSLHNNNNYSQSLHNNSYDHYIQGSPQKQKIDFKAYLGKPLLFGGGRMPMQGQRTKDNNDKSSLSQFHDVQNRKSNNSIEKEMLSECVTMLKDCSSEIKSSLVGIKSDISSDLQSTLGTVSSNFNDTEKVLMKFQEEILDKLKNQIEDVHSNIDLKERILEKDVEIAEKTERINQMEKHIHLITSARDEANNKEKDYLSEQSINMRGMLSDCSASAHSLKQICNTEVEHKSLLEQLLHQNNKLSQELAGLASWQKATNHVLSGLKSSLLDYNKLNSRPALRTPNCDVQSGNRSRIIESSKSSVILPVQNINTDVAHSPLPRHTRWFDANGRPSPAAIVKPQVSKKVNKPVTQLPKKVVPTFDMSSDSDSGNEMSDMIQRLVGKIPIKKQENIALQVADVKATPVFKKSEDKENTTPIQRSIKRYGKVRKFGLSPAANRINQKNNIKGSNTENHVKKKFITLDEHWGEIMDTSDNSSVRTHHASPRGGGQIQYARNPVMQKRQLKNS